MKNIVANGVPMFFTQLSSAVLLTILNRSLFYYGELSGIGGGIAISGMGVASSLQTIILMPILGIVQGAAPIISFNFGARKMDRTQKTWKMATIAATVVASVGYGVILYMPQTLVSMFNSTPSLINFAAHASVVWFFGFPLAGLQILGANYFQATRQPFISTVLNLSRQFLLLIPLVLALPRFFALEGILYAGPVADILSAAITSTFLYRTLKRQSARQQSTAG
jgi:Na+-driven multidrug efflux pump